MRWKVLLALVVVVAVSVLAAGGEVQASPSTYTVNWTGDAPDSNTADGVCDDGTGNCTLRAAIQQANATPGTDTISFNVPGVGPHTIQPASALPTVTDAVIIDGYTQPGASPNSNFPGSGTNAVLKIELDGANAGAQTDGLTIAAGGASTVRGLVINRFTYNGVLGLGAGNVVLQGDFIGTDVTGTADLGNGANGIYLAGLPNSTIGGTTPEARNVISGNDYRGVFFGAPGVVVQGNLIGTNAAGTTELGNRWEGISVYNSSNNTIGGTTAGAGNAISGNGISGVELGYSATSNVVQGNSIGTDAAGAAALGNHFWGVVIHTGASNNTIGGMASGAGNTIGFNDQGGVWVTGATATANTISGNSTHSNVGKGIENSDGGNTELAPPVIDTVGTSLSGHTNPKCYPCTVEVFSDDEDEGRTYHGSTTTKDDATGTWTYTGTVTGPNITATITDAGGNTSEFSLPVVLSPTPTPTPTSTNTPTSTPTSTPTAPPVGGIAELPDLGPASSQEAGASSDGSGSSAGSYAALAGGLAAAALVATAGAAYARRRWLR
jgi:hypothetical protein